MKKYDQFDTHFIELMTLYTAANPGFLERGFLCIKVCVWGWGVRFADFFSCSQKSHENEIVLSHWRAWRGGGGSSEPPEPPLDPPLIVENSCT